MLSVQQTIKDYRDNNLAITAPVDFDNFRVKTHDPYINAVIQNIKDRFPHTGVLASFSCFDPALTRPCSTVDDLQGYADDKFENLLTHYSSTLCEESAWQEWESFKTRLSQKGNLQDILQSLMTKYQPLYPNLAKLAELCLVVPVSTADCERGFSAMKRIKTDLRNRLSQKILNALMMVSTEGPDSKDFHYQRAATLWNSMTNRRIDLGQLSEDSRDN